MDESKPSISPGEFRLRAGSKGTSADIDPPPAELAKSDELVAVARQNLSGQIEVCRNDFSDGPSVTVYYRNEEEVREGFLIALTAMRVASSNFPSRHLKDAGARASVERHFLRPFSTVRRRLLKKLRPPKES